MVVTTMTVTRTLPKRSKVKVTEEYIRTMFPNQATGHMSSRNTAAAMQTGEY